MAREPLPDAHKRYLVALKDLQPGDNNRVGAKATRLADLLRAGFPVPDGFVLTIDAFKEAFQEHRWESSPLPELPPEAWKALRAALTDFHDAELAVWKICTLHNGVFEKAVLFAGLE